MKRTPLRRKSKSEKKKLEDKLWELCKQIIRKKYPNTCYTCYRSGLEGSNWHTGHMISKATLSAAMKHDLRVLRPQCAPCNLWYGGMGADFERNMRKIEGNKYVEKIVSDRMFYNANPIKADEIFYQKLVEEYKEILRTM